MTRAAIMREPGKPIEIEDLPLPVLRPGGVLLETICSEVCGTDVHLHRGHLAGVPYPIIPGHISVGRVVELSGSPVDVDGRPITKDQVVTFLDVHGTCNSCWYCLVAKASTRCPSRRVYGVTYSSRDGLHGGWAEHIHLLPGVRIVPLPADVSARRFIAGGCALPTALHAVDRAEIRLGDSVLIQGAGPVGLNVALLALLSGAGQVLVVDYHELRLEAARDLGVDHTLQISAESPRQHIEDIMELTAGRGADITIEATGAAAAVPEGIEMTRDAGRYVIVGQYTDTGTVPINPHLDINKKHLEIRGVWGIDFNHFYRSVQLLSRYNQGAREVRWESMISRSYPLSQVNEALRDVGDGVVVKAIVEPSAHESVECLSTATT